MKIPQTVQCFPPRRGGRREVQRSLGIGKCSQISRNVEGDGHDRFEDCPTTRTLLLPQTSSSRAPSVRMCFHQRPNRGEGPCVFGRNWQSNKRRVPRSYSHADLPIRAKTGRERVPENACSLYGLRDDAFLGTPNLLRGALLCLAVLLRASVPPWWTCHSIPHHRGLHADNCRQSFLNHLPGLAIIMRSIKFAAARAEVDTRGIQRIGGHRIPQDSFQSVFLGQPAG